MENDISQLISIAYKLFGHQLYSKLYPGYSQEHKNLALLADYNFAFVDKTNPKKVREFFDNITRTLSELEPSKLIVPTWAFRTVFYLQYCATLFLYTFYHKLLPQVKCTHGTWDQNILVVLDYTVTQSELDEYLVNISRKRPVAFLNSSLKSKRISDCYHFPVEVDNASAERDEEPSKDLKELIKSFEEAAIPIYFKKLADIQE